MIYFTSDWHLGEDRIGLNDKPNLFYRPFKSIDHQDFEILKQFKQSGFKDGDTLYHLGDVIYNLLDSGKRVLEDIRNSYPNSELILVKGNYDTSDKMPIVCSFFDEVLEDATLDYFEFGLCYLNHYPTKALDLMQEARLGITGHVHSLWKVQKHLINVGVDAWNFAPVSDKEIEFCFNAMQKFYDDDVFPYCR